MFCSLVYRHLFDPYLLLLRLFLLIDNIVRRALDFRVVFFLILVL